MLLSIAIPAYRHEHYIADTLRSIKNQNLADYEIILVDDCSPDQTYEIAARCAQDYQLPVKLFRNSRNRGILATISRATALSSGQYLCMINSDDVYLDQALPVLIQVLESQPDSAVVYSNGTYLVNDSYQGQILGEAEFKLFDQGVQSVLFYLWTQASRLFLQTLMIRNDFFRAIGGFPDNALAEDWSLNIKIFEGLVKQRKTCSFLPQHLNFAYRYHAHNTSKNLLPHALKTVCTIKQFTPRPLRHLGLANVYLKRAIIHKNSGDLKYANRFYTLHQKHKLLYEANPLTTPITL